MGMTTTIGYSIHNISGATTFHARHFRGGVEIGWRSNRTLDAFLAELARLPWVSDVRVITEMKVAA